MELALLITSVLLFAVTLPAVAELGLFLLAHALILPFARRRLPDPVAEIRKLAVLVPAHNEEKNIARCVASLLASDCGPYGREVVVIADNCSDRTAQEARQAGARVIERFNETVRGKGAALHHAIDILMPEDHDVFVIVDADSVVAPDFVKVMGDCFAGGYQAAQCIYLVLNVDAAPKTRLMNLALLSMNVFRPLGRELLGCSAGIMGNGFALTKSLLREVPYTANSITEDLEYHLKLIGKGFRVRFVRQTRVLADFPVSKEGNDTQRSRWEGGRFMLQRRFMFPLLGRVLSGKLRMVEPFLELMSLPLSYEVLALAVLALLPGHPFRIYALAGFATILCQLLAAVLVHGRKRDFLALFQIPAYLAWKVIKLPSILLTSKKNAAWVRTKRD